MAVTRRDIIQALQVRGGNATWAAEDLGISRRGFYDRMTAFGIDPSEYRDCSVTFSSEGVHTEDDCTLRSTEQLEPGVNTSRTAKWHSQDWRSKFGASMRQVGEFIGPMVADAVEDVSSAMAGRPQAPPRLKRHRQEWLHSQRRQYNAAADEDATASDLLEWMMIWHGEEFSKRLQAKAKEVAKAKEGRVK